MELLSELMERNRKFSSFVEEARRDARCNNLDLPSFLIMPVQRIPRSVRLSRGLLRSS